MFIRICHINCEASGTFGHPPQLWTHVSATLADAAHAFTPCFATRLTHHARLSLHVASGGWRVGVYPMQTSVVQEFVMRNTNRPVGGGDDS